MMCKMVYRIHRVYPVYDEYKMDRKLSIASIVSIVSIPFARNFLERQSALPIKGFLIEKQKVWYGEGATKSYFFLH